MAKSKNDKKSGGKKAPETKSPEMNDLFSELMDDSGDKSMMESLAMQVQAFLGTAITGYGVGMTPELYRLLYEEINRNPHSKKWRDNPEVLTDMLVNGESLDFERLNDKAEGLTVRLTEIIMQYLPILDGDEDGDEPEFNFDPLRAIESFAGADGAAPKFEVPEPIEDAVIKTLRLKIRIKDVTKPPVWRMVDVPAYYSFYELHVIIQTVFGWENAHLWQFQKKAYDSPFCIRDSNGMDDDFCFDETPVPAETTRLTSFLSREGAKLEYVYDFGDDWIHEIEVVEIRDERSDLPRLVKSKGDMMIEDIGGVYAYLEWRNFYNNPAELKKKAGKEFLKYRGFESADEFMDFMDYQRYNIDDINEELSDIF